LIFISNGSHGSMVSLCSLSADGEARIRNPREAGDPDARRER